MDENQGGSHDAEVNALSSDGNFAQEEVMDRREVNRDLLRKGLGLVQVKLAVGVLGSDGDARPGRGRGSAQVHR